MAAVIKRSVKTWMLIYVSLILTFGAAQLGNTAQPDLSALSPGALPGEVISRQSFFRPAAAQAPRNDI